MIDFHSCTPIAAPDCFLVLSVVPAVNELIFNSTGLCGLFAPSSGYSV